MREGIYFWLLSCCFRWCKKTSQKNCNMLLGLTLSPSNLFHQLQLIFTIFCKCQEMTNCPDWRAYLRTDRHTLIQMSRFVTPWQIWFTDSHWMVFRLLYLNKAFSVRLDLKNLKSNMDEAHALFFFFFTSFFLFSIFFFLYFLLLPYQVHWHGGSCSLRMAAHCL